MKTKPTVIALIVMVLFTASPIFAAASTGPAPTSLLASISSEFSSVFTYLYDLVSGKLAATPSSSSATSTVNTSSSDLITIGLGNKSVMVTIIQWKLIGEGYLKGPATGIFDANTQAAVEAYQKAENIPVTGYLQVTTSSAEASFKAAAPSFVPVTVGATGTRATAFQKVLIARGNLKLSTTTAYFGTETQTAVKAFQASHNLPQTGVIDQATFAAMNE